MKHRAVKVAILALVAAIPVQAQQYQQQLRREVERTGAALRDSGYAPAGTLAYGTLNATARDTRPLSLGAGGHYVIVGVCDQDCTGLSLTLADPGGAAAGTGSGSAARPTLEVAAATAGNYLLTIEMKGCRQSPCYWGVQLFRK